MWHAGCSGAPMKLSIMSLLATAALLTVPGLAVPESWPPDQGRPNAAAPVGHVVTRSGVMPMYDAFKKFCIDTAAEPEAVEKAVKISGLPFHKRGPAAMFGPIPMDTTAWDMMFEGHQITLNTGHTMEGSGLAVPQKGNSCTITSWNSDEKASVAALRQWAGISGSADRPMRLGGALTLYEFEVRDSAMLPLKKDDAGRQAKVQGRAWLLMVMGSSAMLIHYLPPTPQP